MFDLGWTELLVIGIVALIVVGPKDDNIFILLPEDVFLDAPNLLVFIIDYEINKYIF